MSVAALAMNETSASPRSAVALQLRAEHAVLAAGAIAAYAATGASWWLFAALVLVPDLGIAGYLAGPRVGARVYNLAHNLAFAGIVAALGWYFSVLVLLAVGLIWMAHICIDRALGYGLKLPGGFKQTHLGAVGKH